MTQDTCELCEQNHATRTITTQTIPGSIDTKFFDLSVCEKCAVSHQEFLAAAWDKRRANEDAHQRGEAAAPELIATAVLTASGPVTYDRVLADFLKARK